MGNIISLFHHRWAMPVLGELHRTEGGAKFITLLNRLQTNRPSLKRTLDALIEAGLVAPNPGYGHPMRPEYVLTKAGAAFGPHCARIMKLLRRHDLIDVGLRKWPLCIVAALDAGPLRFTELRTALPGITARALTIALRQIEAESLVQRTVYDASPPIVEYTLHRRARTIAGSVTSLALAVQNCRAA